MTAAPARPIRLYRFPLSGHCHRAELFLRLLQLPFECIEVDLARGEQKRPEFAALNRFAQVPVIDDDGTVVADSNAILVYLALRYDASGSWYPRDPQGAAQVQCWLSAAAGPLAYGPARARVVQLFGLKQDPSDAIATAHRLLGIIEQTLVERASAFIAGGVAPTIADIALYSYTAHAPEGNVALDDYPALRAWLARVQALPHFAAMPASRIGLAA